jgi:hypothetical protein
LVRLRDVTADDHGLLTRVALLEAKVRVIRLVLEGMIVAFISALIAYFFKG